MDLQKLKDSLTNSLEAVIAANHAIDYFGGHGDTAAMHAIFAKMQFLRIALNDFDKKHGTKL